MRPLEYCQIVLGEMGAVRRVMLPRVERFRGYCLGYRHFIMRHKSVRMQRPAGGLSIGEFTVLLFHVAHLDVEYLGLNVVHVDEMQSHFTGCMRCVSLALFVFKSVAT